MLKFSNGNSKLNHLARYMGYKLREIVSFDLPAGFTCPMADICKTFSNKETGKITRVGRIMCYASKVEAYAPPARRLRWHNFDTLKVMDTFEMADEINTNIPNGVKVVRIHSSGDFFRADYFHAWVVVATLHPEIQFYGYTKILDYVLYEKPDNFNLVYSYGGREDKRRDMLGDVVPTAYIGETDTDYPNIQRICETHDNGHQDFFAIQNHETFVLSLH